MQYNPYQIKNQLSIKSLVSIFKDSYEKNYSYKGEAHNFWEFMLILEGFAYVTINDQIYKVEKGQLLFIKPNVFHNLQTKECPNLKIIIMSFEMDLSMDIKETVYNVADSQQNELQALFSQAKNLFDFDTIYVVGIKDNKEESLLLFIKSLEQFVANLIVAPSSHHTNLNIQSAKIYSKIARYINDNIEKKLTISMIAEHCSLSPSYIKKVFKLYSNNSVINYVSTIKIEKAKQLLKIGMSNKEISVILGFSDQNYFSAHFKKHTGRSPNAWIKQNL